MRWAPPYRPASPGPVDLVVVPQLLFQALLGIPPLGTEHGPLRYVQGGGHLGCIPALIYLEQDPGRSDRLGRTPATSNHPTQPPLFLGSKPDPILLLPHFPQHFLPPQRTSPALNHPFTANTNLTEYQTWAWSVAGQPFSGSERPVAGHGGGVGCVCGLLPKMVFRGRSGALGAMQTAFRRGGSKAYPCRPGGFGAERLVLGFGRAPVVPRQAFLPIWRQSVPVHLLVLTTVLTALLSCIGPVAWDVTLQDD